MAQTNIQLYNELRAANRPLEEITAVQHAYRFMTELYSGYYQADGKPFVAHGVGVASILARLDQPLEILVVGLLHNVYGGPGFGDGVGAGTTAARRKLVRGATGDRVEELIVRFHGLRIHPDTLEETRRLLPGLSATDRALILVDLADHVEKYVDLGALYFGDNAWVLDESRAIGDDLIEIAETLGEPKLAQMLADSFTEVFAEANQIPVQLRGPDTQRYLAFVTPRSCRLRAGLVVRRWTAQMRGTVRVRTRARQVFATVRRRLRSAN